MSGLPEKGIFQPGSSDILRTNLHTSKDIEETMRDLNNNGTTPSTRDGLQSSPFKNFSTELL
jgi:hypothetical protein